MNNMMLKINYQLKIFKFLIENLKNVHITLYNLKQ